MKINLVSPCHPECNEGRAGVNGSLKRLGDGEKKGLGEKIN